MQHSIKALAVGLACHALQAHAGATTVPPKVTLYGPRALYTLSNLSPNSVIALPVDSNGVIGAGTETATGGNGGAFVQSDGVTPVNTDSLGSQDAIVRMGNYLYAVNAGSNSVSSFAIDPYSPTTITLLGAPTSLQGDFPITLAASAELGLVCVGTAGSTNGVECFNTANGFLTPDGVGFRSFGLSAVSPPLMKAASIGDLFFAGDLNFLYATIKGGPGAPTGELRVYPLSGGVVAQDAVVSQSSETGAPFGAFQDPSAHNQIFVSDAAFGAVAYAIAADGTASIVGKGVTNPTVQATCWAEYSDYTTTAFATSPLAPTLVEFDASTAAVKSEFNVTNANGGFIDFVAPAQYLYALAPGQQNGTNAAIVAVNLETKATSQYFEVGFGANNFAHGLAYFE